MGANSRPQMPATGRIVSRNARCVFIEPVQRNVLWLIQTLHAECESPDTHRVPIHCASSHALWPHPQKAQRATSPSRRINRQVEDANLRKCMVMASERGKSAVGCLVFRP